MRYIDVIGLGADGQAGLRPELAERIHRADFLAGGERHLVGERLRPGGRLLANFVTLEHLTLMLQRLRECDWPFEVTEIRVARSDSLAGLTGLKPHRGVFLVHADKPAGR